MSDVTLIWLRPNRGISVKMDGETDGHLHSGRLVRLEVYKVFISHLLAVNAKRDCRDKFE